MDNRSVKRQIAPAAPARALLPEQHHVNVSLERFCSEIVKVRLQGLSPRLGPEIGRSIQGLYSDKRIVPEMATPSSTRLENSVFTSLLETGRRCEDDLSSYHGRRILM